MEVDGTKLEWVLDDCGRRAIVSLDRCVALLTVSAVEAAMVELARMRAAMQPPLRPGEMPVLAARVMAALRVE